MTRPCSSTEWVNCPECGGSGYFAGTFRDIECFHCGGEGSWEIEPETCRDCKRELNDGECPVCDAWLIVRDSDPETGNPRIAA